MQSLVLDIDILKASRYRLLLQVSLSTPAWQPPFPWMKQLSFVGVQPASYHSTSPPLGLIGLLWTALRAPLLRSLGSSGGIQHGAVFFLCFFQKKIDKIRIQWLFDKSCSAHAPSLERKFAARFCLTRIRKRKLISHLAPSTLVTDAPKSSHGMNFCLIWP